jgi:hypothetical protein
LEIPFDHAFDKRGVSLPKSAVRVHPVGLGREAHRVTAAALEAHRQHVRNAHGGEDFRQRVTQFGRLHTLVGGIDV